MAVHVVPPVAGELLLVENRSVCAEEGSPLVSFPPVMADMIDLDSSEQKCQKSLYFCSVNSCYLTSSFDVGVYSGDGRDVVAGESGLWYSMV